MKPETNKIRGGFEGKVVIVTGAASGIGLATAKLFASQGALIVAEDVNPDVKAVFADNDRIVPFIGDVATEEDWQNMARKLRSNEQRSPKRSPRSSRC